MAGKTIRAGVALAMAVDAVVHSHDQISPARWRAELGLIGVTAQAIQSTRVDVPPMREEDIGFGQGHSLPGNVPIAIRVADQLDQLRVNFAGFYLLLDLIDVVAFEAHGLAG